MSAFSNEVVVSNTPDVAVPAGVNVNNFPATQPVSGSISVSGSVTVANPGLTDTQLRATPVPVSGTVTTSPVVSNTANLSQVVLTSNTNVTALSANANRKKIVLFAPKATLYIKLGVTASSTSFSYISVAANTLFEITTWTGQVDVLSTVNQTINVTEMI